MIAHLEYCLLSDNTLLSYLRNGDNLAFEEIYKRYWQALLNATFKRLQNKDASMDVLQNVFTDLWAKKETSEIQNLKAYLFQATRFQSYKYFSRNHHNSPFYNLLDDLLVSSSSADEILMDKEMDGLLQQWIEALPGKRKKIFLLHFKDKLSTHEIAGQLGVSQKTVQNQLGIAGNWMKKNIESLLLLVVLLHAILKAGI